MIIRSSDIFAHWPFTVRRYHRPVVKPSLLVIHATLPEIESAVPENVATAALSRKRAELAGEIIACETDLGQLRADLRRRAPPIPAQVPALGVVQRVGCHALELVAVGLAAHILAPCHLARVERQVHAADVVVLAELGPAQV